MALTVISLDDVSVGDIVTHVVLTANNSEGLNEYSSNRTLQAKNVEDVTLDPKVGTTFIPQEPDTVVNADFFTEIVEYVPDATGGIVTGEMWVVDADEAEARALLITAMGTALTDATSAITSLSALLV